MRTAAIALTALAAGALGPVVGAPGALATDVPAGARIQLSVTGSGEDAEPTTALLACSPNGGTHPRVDEACAALEETGGEFADLPSTESVCTLVYQPVTVAARGDWRGDPIDYRETFANPCFAATHTNGVFAL
ncbi:SSI family serine proteinase inhibitor [Halostreptopolyspora alba]|uniref:Subtilisin inhibitor domain-containing protein n=1 Tax=Halostreptopolyspora alba TaxID=2487137 RepID=A0A3N0EB29_9ACTN|nr:hypothetical protein EFW17_10370 [Nocardiopsaceae bacterium YIM 96095]